MLIHGVQLHRYTNAFSVKDWLTDHWQLFLILALKFIWNVEDLLSPYNQMCDTLFLCYCFNCILMTSLWEHIQPPARLSRHNVKRTTLTSQTESNETSPVIRSVWEWHNSSINIPLTLHLSVFFLLAKELCLN